MTADLGSHADGRKYRAAVAVVIAIALAVRLLVVIGFKWNDPLVGDAIYYSWQAKVIAEGGGFGHPVTGLPAADHPPATAVLFAPASWFPGDVTQNQRLIGVLLGVGVVIAMAALGTELAGPRAGLYTAAVAAVYPGLWINDGLIMSDTPTALVTALLLRAVYRWQRGAGAGWAVGVFSGFAFLTRGELGLLIVLIVVPAAWARSARLTSRLRDLLVAFGVTFLVVMPWTVRNALRFNRPVLLATNDGITLLGANCDVTYFEAIGFWTLKCVPKLTGDQSEVAAAYRQMAWEYIRNHLDRLPIVMAARVGRVWSVWHPTAMVYLNQGEDRELWASFLALWAWWAIVPIAVAGLVRLRRLGVPVWPLLATAVLVTVTAMAFYGLIRFRVPAEVAAVAAAGVALDGLWGVLARPWRRAPAWATRGSGSPA